MNINVQPQKAALWTKTYTSALIVNLLLCTGFQMLLPTIPMYLNNLGASDAVVGGAFGVFVASAFLTRPIMGFVLDKIGRYPVLLGGAALVAAVVFSYSRVSTILLIYILRFIHGIGWAAFTTATSTIATDGLPKERVGEGVGYFGLTTSFPIAMGPAIALSIVDTSGFRTMFVVSASFAAISFIVSLTIKCKKISTEDSAKAKIIIMEKTAVKAGVMMFFVTITYGVMSTFVTLYAIERNFPNVGIFFTAYAVGLIVSRPVFGKIVDRYGVGYAVVPGVICVASAMILLSLITNQTVFVAVGALNGIGFGASHSSLHAMAVMRTPLTRLGAANASFLTLFDLGMSVGSVCAGFVAGAYGYGVMFLAASGSAFICLILFFTLARRHAKTPIPAVISDAVTVPDSDEVIRNRQGTAD